MAEAQPQPQFPWSQPLFPIFDELVKEGKKIFHDSGNTAVINLTTPSAMILYLTARELVKNSMSPPDDFSLCILLGNDLLQCMRYEEEPIWKIFINDVTVFDTSNIANDVASSKYDYNGYDYDAATKVELVKKLFKMLNHENKLSSVNFVHILLGIQQINSSGMLNYVKDISKHTMLSKYEESPNKTRLRSLFEYITLFSNGMVSNIRCKSSGKSSAVDEIVIQTELSTLFDIFTRDGKKSLPFKIDFKYLFDLTELGGDYPGFEIDRNSIVACFDILEFCYQIIIENLFNVDVISRINEINYDGFLKAMIDANGAGGDNFSFENIKVILDSKRASFREAAAAQAASRAAAAAATKKSDNVQARLARLYGGKQFKRKEGSNLRYSKKRSSRRNKNKSHRRNKSRRIK